jgi:Ca-activated chloride channel homolog
MNLFGLWFETPWAFLGLLVLPWMLHRALGHRRHGRVPIPARSALSARHRGFVSLLWWVPDALRIVAVGVLIVAAARPQTEDRQVVTGEGVDIMLALDMSISMNAVDLTEEQLEATLEDAKRPRNRFEIARDRLQDFIVSRSQDRIGLVVFGREAWLKYPLTLDYGRLVATLEELVLDGFYQDRGTGKCLNGCTISGAGTAIGDALGRAYNRVRRSNAPSRVIVLVTDGKQEGGSLDGAAIARHVANLPPDEAVRVYTFLVGSEEQTWLPDVDRWGRPVTDPNGLPMYREPPRAYPTDPALLEESAALTGGKFYRSYDAEDFAEDVEDLEKMVFTSRIHVARSDVFQPLALLALFLLLGEWGLRVTRWRSLV